MRLLAVPQASLGGRHRSWAPPRSVPRSFRPAPAAPSPRGASAASRPVATAGSRTETLRRLLREDGILKGPCCHDALSARLIERAGFSFTFMSGFCTSAAKLGAPDTGLISYTEMLDQGRYIMEATKTIPVIGDGDTGYGNAMNVKRTVRGYAQAGFAGILIEDQVSPKSCGHVRGKRVVSREEAVLRIRAAADARDEGADILIVARTDARQAASMDEAMARCAAFADAGADILFVDALESEAEMAQLCALGGKAAALPKMANMLEGGGKTPMMRPEQLEKMGFKLVAYPLSLLGVSIRAMETALEGLKDGVPPGPRQLGSFSDIQAAVGFPEYFAEEGRYALSAPVEGVSEAVTGSAATAAAAAAATSGSKGTGPAEPSPKPSPEPAAEPTPQAASANAAVEPDAVIEEQATNASTRSLSRSAKNDDKKRSGDAQFFLVRITDKRTGLVKLETRIPTGFLAGISALVPSVQGFDVEKLMKRALSTDQEPGSTVFSTVQGDDKIEVFLE